MIYARMTLLILSFAISTAAYASTTVTADCAGTAVQGDSRFSMSRGQAAARAKSLLQTASTKEVTIKNSTTTRR